MLVRCAFIEPVAGSPRKERRACGGRAPAEMQTTHKYLRASNQRLARVWLGLGLRLERRLWLGLGLRLERRLGLEHEHKCMHMHGHILGHSGQEHAHVQGRGCHTLRTHTMFPFIMEPKLFD